MLMANYPVATGVEELEEQVRKAFWSLRPEAVRNLTDSSQMRLVCLFYSRFMSSTPKGYVDYYKRNRPPPLRTSHNKRNPPPPACAVRISRGMGPPYKSTKEVRKRKRKGN
jgi:hypothetical protein